MARGVILSMLALVLATATGLAWAAPQGLTPATWRTALNAATENAMRRTDTGAATRSGAEVPWRGQVGGGEIVYQPITSRQTEEVCDGVCADPCRRFSMTYEKGVYRARFSGMVCATDSDMQSWRVAGEPTLVSAQGPPSGEAEPAQVAAVAPPPPAPVAPSPPEDLAAATTTDATGSTAAAEIPPPQPDAPAVDVAALRARLDVAFLALSYAMPNDPRPRERAFRAAVRAFAADERLDAGAPIETLVERAEAAQKRSEAARAGKCESPVAAVALVCGRRS